MELRLSMTIRYLAGGSVYDICDLHGVAISTFRKVVKTVVALINAELPITFPIRDTAALRNIADGFAGLSGGVFAGVVLAVDGVLIRIVKPSYNGSSYYSRKGFFGFNVQAGVDSERRIRSLSILSSGSTHDSTAMQSTKLYRLMVAGKLADEFYFVGDDAYKSCQQILCPYPGRDLPHAEDVFNFYQSRTRICVECAFGELVGRWGILWRPLRHHVPEATAIVACCARLHNWCIDHRAPYVRYVRAAYGERGDRDQSGNSAPIFASRSAQGRTGPPVKNAMRDELAAELVDRDMVRPKRSKYRS